MRFRVRLAGGVEIKPRNVNVSGIGDVDETLCGIVVENQIRAIGNRIAPLRLAFQFYVWIGFQSRATVVSVGKNNSAVDLCGGVNGSLNGGGVRNRAVSNSSEIAHIENIVRSKKRAN